MNIEYLAIIEAFDYSLLVYEFKERKGILIAAIGDIADELKEKSEELNQLNLNVPWLEKKIQEHEKSKIE